MPREYPGVLSHAERSVSSTREGRESVLLLGLCDSGCSSTKEDISVGNSEVEHSVPQHGRLFGFHAAATRLVRPFVQVDQSSRKGPVSENEEC